MADGVRRHGQGHGGRLGLGAAHAFGPRTPAREPGGGVSYAQHGRSDAHPGARHVRALVPHRLRRRRGEVRRCLHGQRELDKRRAPSSGACAMKEKPVMKPRFLSYAVTLVAVAALTAPVVARAADPDWKAVEQALGKSGQMQAGDVFRIGMPRTDLTVTLTGVPGKAVHEAVGRAGREVRAGVLPVPVPRAETITGMGQPLLPARAVLTVMNLQPTSDGKAAITGDVVLIDKEVNAVAKTLRQHGVDVTAIHNHALMDTPRLFYMHFWANDDPVKLAQALQAALDQTNSRK